MIERIRIRLARRNLGSTAAHMAHAIQRRYAAIGSGARNISRLLRRQSISPWLRFVDSRFVQFSPRLSFRSSLSHIELTAPVQRGAAGLDQVMQLLSRLAARAFRPSSMMERRRDENPAVIASPRTSEAHSAARPPGRPIDRVLARTQPVIPSSASQAPASRNWSETPVPTDSFAPPKMPNPFPIPAPEVSRLTNEVLKAIDRKLIAHRERAGRR